jgi:hypothetical protein
MNSPSSISHENISRRAHQLWEEAGQPDGQETAHWLQAEHELHAHQGKTSDGNGSRGKTVEPPPAKKHVPEKTPHSTDYVHPGVTTDSLHHFRNR